MAQNGILAPVLTLLVNELWKPIKKHVGYCLKPETNVSNLTKAVDELRNSIYTIEETIQLGEREGKRPKVQVTKWTESARSIEAEACNISNKYEARTIHIFGCSWSCWSNYKISKSAAKVTGDIEDINKRSLQKDDILSLLPPVGLELPLPANIVGQEHYRNKVFGCIEEGPTDIIGICGMGGSGKTTLLKQINNYYSSERPVFDHVMFIEVGKQLNLMAVQQSIASGLGLLLINDGDATHRARAIFNFLKERKFLLLIDDLWDMLDLVKVGIPHGSKCCLPNSQIVLITTRSLDVCGRMHISENVIQLKCLGSDHSWHLFKEIVGGRKMEDAQIRGCAEKIAAKCGGLPLAIKITGQAMASKVASEEREYNLMLVEDSVFHEVSGSDNELFPILKISYDSLQSDVIRMCFLLFAGIAAKDPDDDWETVSLVHCWMGHGLLGEDDDIERTYLRGYSIVEILKRSFLIGSSDCGEKHVKMHHVVQDLALWIVATKQTGAHKEKWLVDQREHTRADVWSTADRIFLCGGDIKAIPSSCSCAHLLTLILTNNEHISEFPAGFFSAMKSLIYLDLSGIQIQEIPSEIGALTSLQLLDLSRTPIHSLPVELGLLEDLRYLYLDCALGVRNIPDGLLSRLKMLRLLTLNRCHNLRINCSAGYIKELKSLTMLRDISFTVQDSDSMWKIYNLPRAFVSGLCITALEGLQSLQISPLLLASSKARYMKALSLEHINLLEEIVIGQTDIDPGWCLPRLETLLLYSLLALQRVEFKGIEPNTCLSGLRSISISDCGNLTSITWITWLPCLESVYLGNCDSIVELVANNEEGVLSATSSFPRLKSMALPNLKNLHSICDGRITFPSLMRLLIYGCPMLMKLPQNLVGVESSPLILGERKWWENLEWEDASSQSSLLPFFREVPAGFRGSQPEVFRALRA
ncbi:probable disease resistance protein At1g61300 [Aegilops tauschii subsp. strangulata]|uniref:AAA+ ATPase domain-containing protein n=2 Tax=Aegilops tauschii TaxID=37682 RepID=A0A453DCR2_AEGTS|nr:disease resistance protein SUMM2 [Aegilops tauschii subsp. strangulata]